ncbi:MAG: flagellar biosynthesis anti-sigma factor FlgM [Pseudomonadota bacterium]
MSNDIDAIFKQQPAAAQQTAQSRKAAAGQGTADAGQAAGGGDTVQLTDSARVLHELERAVADAPVVDATRVGELAQAVASGEYQVDAERVAEKILQLDREFGTPG